MPRQPSAKRQNQHASVTGYLNADGWIAHNAPVLILPSAWISVGEEPSLSVTCSRITFGWLRFRFRIEWGSRRVYRTSGTVDWSGGEMEDFRRWINSRFASQWSRDDLNGFFNNHPRWRKLIGYSGTRAHYTRILLAREIHDYMSMRSASDTGEGALVGMDD